MYQKIGHGAYRFITLAKGPLGNQELDLVLFHAAYILPGGIKTNDLYPFVKGTVQGVRNYGSPTGGDIDSLDMHIIDQKPLQSGLDRCAIVQVVQFQVKVHDLVSTAGLQIAVEPFHSIIPGVLVAIVSTGPYRSDPLPL